MSYLQIIIERIACMHRTGVLRQRFQRWHRPHDMYLYHTSQSLMHCSSQKREHHGYKLVKVFGLGGICMLLLEEGREWNADRGPAVAL